MMGTRPTRMRWVTFVLACALSWLLYLHRYSWGIIKPEFKKENPHLTDTELGWLDSAFNATYALGQIPGGLAGDILGPHLILTGSILFWSLGMVGVVWVGGFVNLLGMRALFGLAQAPAYPVVNKLTRSWFPPAIRTSVQGVVTALGRIGAACASVILATLLMGRLGLSWQNALLVLAVPGLILTLAFLILVRNTPAEHPWCNSAEQELIGGAPAASGAEKPRLTLDRWGLLSLGMMLLYAFASTFQDQLYVYWIPLFLVAGHGMDQEMMGLFAPLPLLGGAVGGVLGGVLNDWLLRVWGNRRWARSLVALTGKTVAAVLVLVSVQLDSGEMAMLLLLAARVFGDWSLATQWGAVTDMGGRAAGTVFGLVNAVGALGGFVAGPVLGYLKQHHGWEGLFLGVAVMCLVAAFTWLFIDCTKKLVSD